MRNSKPLPPMKRKQNMDSERGVSWVVGYAVQFARRKPSWQRSHKLRDSTTKWPHILKGHSG